MKCVALFVFVALCINLSTGKVKLINCPEGPGPLKDPEQICARVTCVSDQKFNMVGCAESRCEEGKQIGYKDVDNSKVYPECCGEPICAD